MIDIKLLRVKPKETIKKLIKRGIVFNIDEFLTLEKDRKFLQIKLENLNSERNSISKIIGIKKEKQNIQFLFEQSEKINKEIHLFKKQLDQIKNKIYEIMLKLPNLPDDVVPSGTCELDNVEITRWGIIKQYDFSVKDHVSLGELTNELDFLDAAKITGSRFFTMRGGVAKLHRALTQFMLDLHIKKHDYTEVYVPYLVNYKSLYGSGQLPKFDGELFCVDKNSKNEKLKSFYALIPTAEVPLVNLVREKILQEDMLPIRLVAHTPCFRLEAGSYGRDTRGLIRTHQFDKVELVHIVHPKESMEMLEQLTQHAEIVLKLLNLPYRKILLCAKDLGFSSCKTYDLEVWFPSQNTYREISSCSNTSDFQSRRMKARFRSKKDKKIYFVHILNGSGLAVGRTLAAIMENYQKSDGKIEIPKILYPYMDYVKYINYRE